MKILVWLVFVLLIGDPLWAAPPPQSYWVSTKIFVDGENISSPRIVTLDGESSSITSETDKQLIQIEVLAKEGERGRNQSLLLKMKVKYSKKDGSRTITAKPVVLVPEGQPAFLTFKAEGDNMRMNLKVVATKQSM